MGYCMTQRDCHFIIKAENQEKAMEAIKALAKDVDEKGSGGSWSGGGKTKSWYSWVETEEFANAETLADALKAWRWIAEDNKGDIDYLYFEGDKLGQEDILFEAIAPFVEEGSYIEMSGEDGALWRWAFEQGMMVEREAQINWK